MIVQGRGEVGRWKSWGGFEVIIHIKDVGQETFGGWIYLLHLVLYLNGLQAKLFTWS